MNNEYEYEHSLVLSDLIAARDAMESWYDAFHEEEEEQDAAAKVQRTINAFNNLIEIMQRPERPQLKLVNSVLVCRKCKVTEVKDERDLCMECQIGKAEHEGER